VRGGANTFTLNNPLYLSLPCDFERDSAPSFWSLQVMSEPSTPGNAAGNAAGDDQMELLMRHSSPVVRAGSAESPLSERNSSPSPLRMNRPRSNPRNRTPMRYTSPLNADAFRIPEGDQEGEARRISIRPLAGRAVGTTMAGPSHVSI
jgi:hypothetical protein